MSNGSQPNSPEGGWRVSPSLASLFRRWTLSPSEADVDTPTGSIEGGADRSASSCPQSGWERVKAVYGDNDVHMERDVTVKMTRMAFAVGTFIGGMSGYATTRQRYEMYSSGRTYLSARDVLRRKWDYGIVMFVKHGFRTGLLSAALVGSVVLLTTHYALWRNRFSAWYFPVVSGANALLLHRASVGTVLSFPLGLMGSLKALGLGISSGLSLSAVVMLYAISIDKSVDETYAVFKHDYEEELRNEKKREDKLQAFMAEHNIPWRYTAIKKMREEEERRLFEEPD